MDDGLNLHVYHFLPKQKVNNRLILFHRGHWEKHVHGNRNIDFFLEREYSVLAFSMPLLGMNNRPTINTERDGKIRLKVHEDLKLLDSPIKPFVEPIAVSLNHVLKELYYDLIAMVGTSGRGWTTYLYSAIDQRIYKSYPVAGGYPLYLASLQDFNPDYEAYSIELLQIANCLELFILGSYGNGRSQLQIFNRFDPIISPGVLFQTYEDQIASLISRLGKVKFEVFLDSTHREHKAPKHALEIILKDMEEN
jgi:hypothetical protein|tara:strand:+ start:5298 stop:6050 length:753 start_codon:yes stop_codon:yes gene_type:complete